MFGMGMQEILLIVLVVGLLFGARKLPDMLRSLGEGLKEFRKATRDSTEI